MSQTRLAYYPGCTLKTKAEHFEISALEVANALDTSLIEPSRWNCCGTVFSLTDDDLMHHLAPIRILIRIQEMMESGSVEGRRVIVLCSMCFNTLKRANLRMRENPEDLEKVNDMMYLEEDYKGKVEVFHFLELLRERGFDQIRKRVEKPLSGVKVAPYYGCMLLRPKEIGIDDPEAPTIQGDLYQALGADVIEFPYARLCCGSYQTVHKKEVVGELAYDILSQAQQRGAELLVTSCPLCAYNLDNRQKEVQAKHPEFQTMPVLYFTQLIALAFGLDKKYYGLDQNYIDPEPLLRAKKLL